MEDAYGEEVLAAVVLKPGTQVTASEIRDWCAERLAAHKIPRFVVFLKDVPHTSTHKVAKFALKARAEELRLRADDAAATSAEA